jgi:hypothetical protein
MASGFFGSPPRSHLQRRNRAGTEGKDYWTSGVVFVLVGGTLLMQADKIVKIAYP